MNIAEILTDQGHLDESKEILKNAADVFTAAGDRWGECFTKRCLGIVASRSWKLPRRGPTLLESGRGGMLAIGANADVISADIAIADNLVLAGAGGEALLVLGRVLPDGEPPVALGVSPRRSPPVAGHGPSADRRDRQRVPRVAAALARRQESMPQLAAALEALERVEAMAARTTDWSTNVSSNSSASFPIRTTRCPPTALSRARVRTDERARARRHSPGREPGQHASWRSCAAILRRPMPSSTRATRRTCPS